MGARAPIDAQYTRFLVESYDKERDARLRMWSKSYKPEVDTVESSQMMKVLRKKVLGGCPVPNAEILAVKDLKPKNFNRRVKNYEDESILERAGRSSLADAVIKTDMYPVPSRVRNKLYDGFTKEEKGRYRYLNLRKLTAPETRFRLPVVTSWDYGWRLRDSIKPGEVKFSKFARTRLVQDTFYTRNYVPSLNLEKDMY